MKSLNLPFAVVSVALLGACGGGGGGSSGEASQNVEIPLRQALINQANNGISDRVAVTGTIDGNSATGSGTLVDQPAVATTITENGGTISIGNSGGTPVLESIHTVSETVTESGMSQPVTVSDTTVVFTNPSTGAEVAEIHQDTNTVVEFPAYTIPETVKPGDSGVLGVGTEYNEGGGPTGNTEEIDYSVQADTPSDALVIIEKKEKDKNGNVIDDKKREDKVDKNGNDTFVYKNDNGQKNGHADDLTGQNEQ